MGPPRVYRNLMTGLLVLAVVATGWAQDNPPDEGDEQAPTQLTGEPKEPKLGYFVEVLVEIGELEEMTGWLRSKARCEFKKDEGGYEQKPPTQANREAEGAGIRLYYVDGLNGFAWVPYTDILSISDLREISFDEEQERLKRAEELERKVEEERRKRLEEMEAKAKADAEAAASEEGEEGTAEETTEDPDAGASEEILFGLRQLEDFPPDWGQEKYRRMQRILQDRRGVLTSTEQKFYDLWEKYLRPARAWRKAHPLPAKSSPGK